MDKKLFSSIAYGFVFTAFVVVSILVIVSKRNSFFIRKKLQLGALLIFLTGASNCGIGPEISCYAPIPYENEFTIDQADAYTNEISITHSNINILTGTIDSRTSDSYSWMIVDAGNSIVYSDNLLALDGNFDEYTEEFTITIPEFTLLPGTYSLRFFTGSFDLISDIEAYIASFNLVVLN